MKGTCWIGLLDSDGNELIPFRTFCEFEGEGATWGNTAELRMVAPRTCEVVRAGISQQSFGEFVATFDLNLNTRCIIAGNLITIPRNGITMHADNGVGRTLFRVQETAAPTYEDWMKDKRNTPIHPQEIWDAAFLAGSQFTHTLY